MIDAATVEQFQCDGAVCIRRLFQPGEMAVLRAGIDENLAALSPRAKIASAPDDPGRFVEDFGCFRKSGDTPNSRGSEL